MAKLLFPCLVIFANYSLAGEVIPLPFEGLYESRGSFAKEQVARDQWREIPQDVQMRVVKDKNIIKLQLRIQVYAPEGKDGSSEYTIPNQMWLVKKPQQSGNAESGRVDFDVFKTNPHSGRFDDCGDGYCGPSECRYSYITKKPGYQQRYHSHITWQPQQAGTRFEQRGGLSLKKDGESEWLTFKTWENTFRRNGQDHELDR